MENNLEKKNFNRYFAAAATATATAALLMFKSEIIYIRLIYL